MNIFWVPYLVAFLLSVVVFIMFSNQTGSIERILLTARLRFQLVHFIDVFLDGMILEEVGEFLL